MLAMKVNILEAKNRLSELIRAVQAGEEVIIANRGEPVARLVPIAPATHKYPVGSAAGILAWLATHRPAHQRSAAEIDADIAAERAAWDD